MRILIAEDEVSIAKALRLMLEKNKYSVDVVHNGADALDYICAGEYDALVLDIMMPGMDGISVLTEARRAGRKNEIAVSNTCRGAESIDTTRLFDRFYRADESHSGRIGGTGIGLSIARATAEAHGGTISAEVNGNTITFRVRI